MERDSNNIYREQLEDLEPDFQDRVNTPWQENVPDVPSYNKRAYTLIERHVKRMSKTIAKGDHASSRGVLILGEPGTGKTHLLMRVAHRLGNSNHIMFVRKPNNESAVASHIWINILQSLTQKIPGSTDKISQLNKMLARVFTAVIIPFLEKDIAAGKDAVRKQTWVDKLKENPENFSSMLGKGETRVQNVNFIRRRTLSYLSENEPNIDQKTARALITYCFIVQPSYKYALLSWLQGQQIESGTASILGIQQTWVGTEENIDLSIRQQNEEQALRAIKTIGLLAQHYQPLILAFDQLEGLNQQKSMTLSWGDTVREIFTVAPNFVIVTCIFPSIWQSWFEQQLDQSVRERVAQYTVFMDEFSIGHARDILSVRMKNACEIINLPHEIYPFTQYDIDTLCNKTHSLRSFLNNASNRFDQWLDSEEEVMNPQQPTLKQDAFVNSSINAKSSENTEEFDEEEYFESTDNEDCDVDYVEISEEELQEYEKDLKQHEETLANIREEKVREIIIKTLEKQQRYHSRSIHNHICNEEEFFGLLRDFITQFLHCSDFKFKCQRSSYRNLVIPPNATIEVYGCNRPLVIAVCSKQGYSLTSRIKNLVSYTGELKKPLVILLKNWSNGDALSNFYVKKLQKNGYYLRTSKKDSCLLMALYDLLIAVEQQDLIVNDIPVDKTQLFEILLQEKVLNQAPLFHIIIDREKWPQKYNYTKQVKEKKNTYQSNHLVKKMENTNCTLLEYQSASFFNNLELPTSSLEDFKSATEAISEEFECYEKSKVVEAHDSELIEEQQGRKIYRLKLSSSLYFDWKIEGSTASCFEDDSKQIYRWRGDIVGFVLENKELFIATNYEIEAPCEFYIQPFEFMHNLYSLYKGEEYQELTTKYLPPLLAACKGKTYPLIQSRSSYGGIEKLRDLWQHSWGIIWGPPGTGKTYTIGQQVASCVQNNTEERFLIVSTTNKATDEAVLSVAKALFIPAFLQKVIRVGRGVDFSKFNDNLSHIVDCKFEKLHTHIAVAQNKFSRSKSTEEQARLRSEINDLKSKLTDRSLKIFLDKKYKVVVTTAFNTISMLTKTSIYDLLSKGKTPFTTVIIDEAGIISKAATAVLGMLASSRVILAGDPKQLSPISKINRILPSNQSIWLGESALNHLQGDEETHSAKHILRKQYRMHPQICRVVSSYQYASKLQNSQDVIERDQLENYSDLPRASWYIIDEDVDSSETRARRSEQNTSWLRPHTCKVLDRIFIAFPKFIDIDGLFIAPFTAQIETINNYFVENNMDNWQAATVHSQQGVEADIIIFDTVYASSSAWSYTEWQRLINVAISRAKQWVILIASRQEMQQPYLAPLTDLLTPVIIPKGKKSGTWQSVAAKINYDIPQQILDNPHLLGNQLRNRKMLRPILSFEQQRLCQLTIDGKPRLVRGVAGSGKTVVLAHWIAKSLTENRDKQICVVYANASLKSLIHNTIRKVWNEEVLGEYFPEKQLFLIHIIDLLKEVQDTLDISYKGNHYDYEARADLYLQELKRIKPLCDELFIDEAQDLGPTTLKLLFHLIKENPVTKQRPAMIFYDNAQNLYDRKTPKWSDFGLELRGRSTIMKESFRSTNPICEFATNVLYNLKPSELNSDHQELVNLGLLELIKAPQRMWKVHYNKVDGPKPKFFEYNNLVDEIEAIGNQIQEWVEKEGVTPNDITILYLGKNIPKRIMKDLAPELTQIDIQMQWQTSSNFDREENTIILTTPHSFKGYDSEIIVIAGADQFASSDDEIRARSLYVAMTRARSILYVYSKTHKRDSAKKTLVDVLRKYSG